MWDRAFIKTKLKASGLHLTLSAGAFCPVLWLILQRWYPQPWFPIDGGWQGVRIMVFVDLVIGPTLTFIVFNAAKTRRALLFDFSAIGLVQACAFVWGVYAVHAQRPVAIAYFNGAFYSFEEKPLFRQGRSAGDLAQLDPRVPALVYTETPRDKTGEEGRIAKLRGQDLADFEQFELLRPVGPHLEEVFERSDQLAQMLWSDPKDRAALERLLRSKPGLKQEDLRFVWFLGRYEEATLVFDQEGSVLGSVRYVNPKNQKSPAPA